MAIRRISYLEPGKGELVMPVAPESYNVSFEKQINTVNITSIGDVTYAGYRKATSWTDKFLLPAHSYSFNNAGADTNPKYYIAVSYTHLRERVQISKRNTFEDAAAKLADLEDDIGEEINRFIAMKTMITRQIDCVPDNLYATLLSKRYLSMKTWEEIADDLNYDLRTVYKLHDKALKAFENSNGQSETFKFTASV